MKVLVIDNYDSFTYNLVHAIEKILGQAVDVFRNDEISLDDIEKYDKIVVSPGPGVPDEAGISKAAIKRYAPTKSILGVCLGHQSIGEVFGGKLQNIDKVYHGVATEMTQTAETPLFKGVPKAFMAGRYHSWIVDTDGLPDCFEVTAVDEFGAIMAFAHKTYDVLGVQFHPESVLTPDGGRILANWLEAELDESYSDFA